MWRPAVAMMLCATAAFAQKVIPGDQVYTLHSEAQGTCPSMDWHIVASPDGVLSGMIGLNNMKTMTRVAGSILPHVQVERFGPSLGGSQVQQFRMIVSEIAGRHRIADVTGIIQPNGWMIAAIDGGGVECHDVRVPLFVPAAPP